MVLARVHPQASNDGKLFGLREGEGILTVSYRPQKRPLHERDVMKTIPDRLVVTRRRMVTDRAPMFGVGPDLVPVEIAEE